MGQARTNARRRKQAANGYSHISKGRPVYRKKALSTIAAAIEAEHRRAQRMAAASKK